MEAGGEPDKQRGNTADVALAALPASWKGLQNAFKDPP